MTLLALRRRRMGRPCGFGPVLGLALLLVLGVLPSRAQRAPGSWTVGPQVGRPGGLTAKVYRTAPIAYDALLTVDGDDFVRGAAYRLWERPLPDSLVYVYYGPGLAAIARDLDTDPVLHADLAGKLGLNFYAERFEVFLHVTPILRLQPRPVPRIGAGVGLRYDLHQP